MLNPEHQPLTAPRPLQWQASSVDAIDWSYVSECLGKPGHVLLDYDQATALATNEVPHQTKQAIIQARHLGKIASFSIASDNPLAGRLSGMQKSADYIFTPFITGPRLVTKSTPVFYERIVKILDVEPNAIVMVGHDDKRDIDNAQKAGISTIQVPPLGTILQGLLSHRGRKLQGALDSINRSV